jgi:FkbM family methyltransferase
MESTGRGGLLQRLIATSIVDPIVEQLASRLVPAAPPPPPPPLPAPSPELSPGGDAPTDRDYVLWAYRLLLGREPEDPGLLERHVFAGDHWRLVHHFLKSDEFRHRQPDFGDLIGQEMPPYFLTELPDGTRFWVNLRDEHVSRGIIGGSWEPAETAFIARCVTAGMHALDIGANLGWFTVHMSRLVGPSGRVTAFEPRADIFAYLAKTISENRLDNVTFHNCAVGPEDGDANVYWARTDTNPGGTHLVPAHLDPVGLAAGFAVQPIAMRSLDSVVDGPVDFIKIDVEGAEKLVFDGAERILRGDRPVIVSEIAPDSLALTSQATPAEYVSFFAERGYAAREIDRDGRPGPPICCDHLTGSQDVRNVVFVPRERNWE